MEHPINEQIKNQIAEIEDARATLKHFRNQGYAGQFELAFNGVSVSTLPPTHSQPVYIINKDLEIIARVESKRLVGPWIKKNGYWFKVPGRSTIYEYIKDRKLYKNKLYFVEVSRYEEFMKEKS